MNHSGGESTKTSDFNYRSRYPRLKGVDQQLSIILTQMSLRTLRPDDYTVGWVSALPVELAAATEFLDEEHKELPQDDDDNNLYTLGSIGKHNVVIACLPAGQTGTNSATTVAMQMKRTFHSIRFGLMVGIGGGVPSDKVDIRLGDVVVSQPFAEYGGVIQYDLGKSTPSGFIQTGFLSPPPRLLLNALAKVQALSLRGKYHFQSHLSKIDHIPEFRRDHAGPDILFESTYNHIGGSSCETCDREKLKKRMQKGRENSMAHYGIIASSNQVMKDGTTRDNVSSKLGGVLCFEMEAAGLMNDFPCLVIRGM